MKNIAIVCGGFSGEYDISIQSAQMVKENLDSKKYNSYIIFIEKGEWYHKDEIGSIFPINRKDFSFNNGEFDIYFDGVFNAIHGEPGEDGKLLGYFDMLNIPYTSSSADVSALTFNKYLCNKFIDSIGVNTARSISFTNSEQYSIQEIIEILGLPLFVKPACSGSSVGVSKVKTADELNESIIHAFKSGDRIIIEEFIEGREIDCGLYRHNNELIILPLTEIKSENEFFDYEAKYTAGKAYEITPPENLDFNHEIELKATSSLIYNKLGCKGIVRIDFILAKTGLYFIEINTVPGMSEASIVPKQAKAMGINISDLFGLCVENMFENSI
jgi:D-alanine-D-alanine ligase